MRVLVLLVPITRTGTRACPADDVTSFAGRASIRAP